MMGQQPRSESLFYYFRLEDQIPEDHLLKRLDRCIDFGFAQRRRRLRFHGHTANPPAQSKGFHG
jgi:hypothetical protein